MAESLKFPISFNLKEAVKNASKEWKDTYAKELEAEFAKRAIPIKLKIDGIAELDEVKKKLEGIHINPLSTKTKANIQSLAKDLNGLADALKNVSRYSTQKLDVNQRNFDNFVRLQKTQLAKEKQELDKKKANLAEERLRQSEERVRQADVRIYQQEERFLHKQQQDSFNNARALENAQIARQKAIMSQEKHNLAMRKGEAQMRLYNKHLEQQGGLISKLAKRAMAYASIYAVVDFVSNIRKVTAEFELQRISLGAIIQDQNKANKLFGDIKSFAIKSPLNVMQLTSAIKQVAAYRIETDQLFDTTKRLADVSVGLGVEMERLVLAYGQTKAASYLRASEIRQFTEAGLPMLELLSEKFSLLQGKAVSTGEVMEMVSNRMVSFQMVAEIFKDLTSEGGMFFNMQEKQSETLFGMWAKLGDAASLMFDEMGRGEPINMTMKGIINSTMTLMEHWDALAVIVKNGTIAFSVYKLAMAGLVPFYNLHNASIMRTIKMRKLEEASSIKQLSKFVQLDKAQRGVLYRSKQLTQQEWREYITTTNLNRSKTFRLARLANEDIALRRALVSLRLYNEEQIREIGLMSKRKFLTNSIKAKLTDLGTQGAGLMGMAKMYAPLLAISAVVSLISEWLASSAAKAEAFEKVEKKFIENANAIDKIEVTYKSLNKELERTGKTEKEIQISTYSAKIKELEKVVALLKQFGQYNVIDLSVVNYDNIDATLSTWVKRLNSINRLTKLIKLEIEDKNNDIEFGGLFGENLKSDMKDWKRAWVNITANKEFEQSLTRMQNILTGLKNTNIDMYQSLSKAIGIDALAGLGDRRKFETELQYRKRLVDNYAKIYEKFTLSTSEGFQELREGLYAVGKIRYDFATTGQEIENEIAEKLRQAITGKDAFSVKAAIDVTAAEQGWEDWQKEYIINFLNKEPRVTINAEIIPIGENGKAQEAMQGMKAILNSEFKNLFTEQELQGLGSMTDILEQIQRKGEEARNQLSKLSKIELSGNSQTSQKKQQEINKLQEEIELYSKKRHELEELQKLSNPTAEQSKLISDLELELSNYEPTYMEDRLNKINAILTAEKQVTDEYNKQKESLEEQIRMSDEALARFSNKGMSTLAKQVSDEFSGLMVNPIASVSDSDYFNKGLISDEDLTKVKDILDLQELWRKKTEEVTKAEQELARLKSNPNEIDAYNQKINEKRALLSAEIAKNEQMLVQIGREKDLQSLKELSVQINIAKNETERNKLLKKRQDLVEKLSTTNAKDFIIARELAILERDGLSNLDTTALDEHLNSTKKGLEEMQKLFGFSLLDKNKNSSSSSEDPYITLIKNRMKYMQDFEKGTRDLQAFMGKQNGLFEEQANMFGRGKSLGINSYALNGTESELIAWYEDTISDVSKKIAAMGGKEWTGIGVQMILGKDTKNKVIKKYQELLQELFDSLTDFRTDKVKRAMEEKIKQLSEDVKRTKVVQDFFKNALDLTGDVGLASSIADALYGDNGSDLFNKQVEHIKELFKGDAELDLSSAIDLENSRINYQELERIFRENQDKIKKNNKETIQSLISDGQKLSANEFLELKKRLLKAKDYEAQRIEVARKAKEERDRIIKMNIPEEEKQSMLEQSEKKEGLDLSAIDIKELTESEYYQKAFQDLGDVAYKNLGILKKHLEEIIKTDKNLSPQNVKTLASAIQRIGDEMQGRIFGGGIWDNFKKILEAQKAFKKAEAEFKEKQSAYNAQKPIYDENIRTATKEREAASVIEQNARMKVLEIENQIKEARENGNLSEEQLNNLERQKVASQNALVTAQLNLNNAREREKRVVKEKRDAEKEVSEASKKARKENDNATKASNDLKKNLTASANSLGVMADFLGDLKNLLGISSDSAEGLAFDSAIKGLQTMQSLIILCTSAMVVFNMIANQNPIGWIIMALSAAIALFTFFVNNKARTLENKIQDIKDRVEEMEHAFERLEKAQNKAFGTDYISNYEHRLRNLQAQQAAYAKMAEYEKEKGKKSDEEKVKEYLDKSQDATDKILDMQNEISEKMTDTSVSSAAADFAKSWLEASLSFANTTNVLKGKFKEMMRSMVVNSLLARVVQMQLQPIFDMIDDLAKDGDLSASDIAKVFDQLPDAIHDMNAGMETMMQTLSKAGINAQDLIDTESGMKGIARDISTASEESINGLAAGINTQNHYISYIPTIAREVALMRGIMENGAMPTNAEAIDISKQSLVNLQAINRNTATTANEVKNMYNACVQILGLLGKTIKPRGIKASHTINTSL